MNDQTTKAPISFWIISGLGLLWNLMGCYNWFLEYGFWSKPETRVNLGELGEQFGPIYDATPGWVYIIFAIAVVAGVLGSIGLLIRKAWAVKVFLISLIAIVIQFSHFLFATDVLKILGGGAAIMPAVVIAIGAFLWYFAKRNAANGILN